MSRSLRRGALAAVLAFSLASLAACAAGNDAQTLEVKPDTAATTVGDIKVQNAYVVTQPQRRQGPAVVAATLFNNGTTAQTLHSVQLGGARPSATLPGAKGSRVRSPSRPAAPWCSAARATPPRSSPDGREAAHGRRRAERRLQVQHDRRGRAWAPLVVPATSYFRPSAPARCRRTGDPLGSARRPRRPGAPPTRRGHAEQPAGAARRAQRARLADAHTAAGHCRRP